MSAHADSATAADTAATADSPPSCAKKASASDCPLPGAVRVEPGFVFLSGLFYRKQSDRNRECAVRYVWTDAPAYTCQLAFEHGCQYLPISGIHTVRITAITGDAEVWFAPLADACPISLPPSRPLAVGTVLRQDETISYLAGDWANDCIVVLRRLDTGEETAFSLSENTSHVVQTDSEVAYCQCNGFLMRLGAEPATEDI